MRIELFPCLPLWRRALHAWRREQVPRQDGFHCLRSDAFLFRMDVASWCVGDCALTCAGGERKNLVLRLVELGEKATQEDSRSRRREMWQFAFDGFCILLLFCMKGRLAMASPGLPQRGSGELCPAWAWPILRAKACHRCFARSSQCWLYPTLGNSVDKSLEGQFAGREESEWQLCVNCYESWAVW